MILKEFECEKCGYSFTRLYKDKKEAEELKEKCKKCEGRVKIIEEIDLSKNKPDCSGCSGGGCSAGGCDIE